MRKTKIVASNIYCITPHIMSDDDAVWTKIKYRKHFCVLSDENSNEKKMNRVKYLHVGEFYD